MSLASCGHRVRVIAGLLALCVGLGLPFGHVAFPQTEESDEEASRQAKVIERFLVVLEKNPRRGTALDKVYGYHIETGSIDALVQRYADQTTKNPQDGIAWMIRGLIEAQRGRDAMAVESFTKAAELLPANAMASYYLGQSLVLVGQPDKAVEAFEAAIARKPVQADSLEIFQALGRVHQRAQRTQEALACWTRLEKLFPNDPRVQEQIAATLVEEGQPALALPRYESLIGMTKDDYRKSSYRIEAAELKVKLNRSQEAIGDLEALLATLNPTSWLHRDVRRRIDEIFLRTDNYDGLTKYYEAWVAKNPEDVDAMARLARTLAKQARVPEAQVWLDKALKLAPSRKELRLAFIDQLVDDQRYPEAIAQYQELDKTDPNNPDLLRDWGKLILRDTSRPKEQRKTEAETVWRRLLVARPKDPLIATQVADLFRHSEMPDAALELYQKAVELAPEQPQYREYLGEFYHQRKEPEKALATWRVIAEGKNRTAVNVARLAEVLASFGYLKDALPEISAACELDPKDFSLQMKSVDLFAKADQPVEALAALTRAEALAQNEEERESVLTTQIRVYDQDRSLQKRSEELAQAIAAGQATARQHYLLARYQEGLHDHEEAARSIEKALALEPQSIPLLATAARLSEQAGNLKEAGDLNRRLATVDRRGRSDYLRRVAQLEMQLGRTDEAIAAGRDLLASAPGNTENYEFFAGLCFRLGQTDEGLQTLRRAVRLNPGEPQLLLVLAGALAEQFRTDEAIEIYWQAFDKGQALDDRLAVVQKLTDQYLQSNRFDKELERLERQRSDADDKRETTICLAQAYQAAGDYGMARQELESLLTDNSRDTQLLQQLANLAGTENDLSAAVKYQEQLVRLAPGPETEYKLATLLSQNGAAQESSAILVRLASKEEDPEKLMRNIDSLLGSEQTETALLIIQARLRDDPRNWELLYREGAALSKTSPAEAAKRFEAILALPNADEELTPTAKNQAAKAAKAAGGGSGGAPSIQTALRSLTRTQGSYEPLVVAGLLSRENYGMARAFWGPSSFGDARLGSIAWIYRFGLDAGKSAEVLERFNRPVEADGVSPRALWDAAYLQSILDYVQSSSRDRLQMTPLVRKLAQTGELGGHYRLITSLQYRTRAYRGSQQGPEPEPLSKEDMDLVLRSFTAWREWSSRFSDSGLYTSNFTPMVLEELKRAGRTEEEQRLFQELLTGPESPAALQGALAILISRENVPEALQVFDRLARLSLKPGKPNPTQRSTASQAGYQLAQLVGTLGAAKKTDEVLAILDRYLDYNQERSAIERAKPRRSGQRSTRSQGSNYYQIYNGKSSNHVQVAYPVPGPYYEMDALMLLRNAFEVFSRNDLLSDLQKHLEERLAAATESQRIDRRLALVAFHSWNDDAEGAVRHIAEASRLAPQDWELRTDVAQLHAASNRFEDALAIVDEVVPVNQETMRDRESLALDYAVRLGDLERARTAAERLFGLRLDAGTQLQLVSQMRRLGMNEQAEAVLNRVQRQAGSNLSSMATLMSMHQAQGQADLAVQIARQILRRSRPSGTNTSSSRRISSGGDDGNRSAALQVLSASGKLKELIQSTEEQLARSPQSSQLHQALTEYYQAAGDNAKVLELQRKIVEARPDDAVLRYRFAQQLQGSQKFSEACDEFLAALKLQPQLLSNDYYEVTRAFQSAKRLPDLTKFLEGIDLRRLGQSYVVSNLLQNAMNNKEQRPAVMALFKKAWEQFPEQRQYFMTSFYNEEAWDSPEIVAYGKEMLLPTSALTKGNPWYGINQVNSYGGNGETYTAFQNLVKIGLKTNQLEAIRGEVAAAVEKNPDWKGGPLVLAAIQARSGQVAEARTALEAFLKDKKPGEVPQAVGWIVGQVLEPVEDLRGETIRLYELALGGENNSGMREFQYSPGPRLIQMYIGAKRRDDAKALLAKSAKGQNYDNYDASYALSQKMSGLFSIGQQYEQLDFSIDALRMYREALELGASDKSNPNYNNRDYYTQQTTSRLQALMEKLAKSNDPALVEALLRPRNEPGKPVIDLMLSLQKDRSGSTDLGSPVATLLAAKALAPENLRSATAALDALRTEHADDFSLRITEVLLALRGEDPAAVDKPLAELEALVGRTPLEPLPPGTRANARQREEAAGQMDLWIVVKACAARKDLAARLDPLATRSVEAALRQTAPDHAQAMLHQRSILARDAGDKDRLEKSLTMLVDSAVVRPVVKKSASPQASAAGMPPRPPRPPGTVPGAKPGEVKPAATTALIPPLTLSQFRVAMNAAQLAADSGLPEIALRAIRDSLAGGLPVPDVSPATSRTRGAAGFAVSAPALLGSGNPSGSLESPEILQAVGTSLSRLSQTWRQKKYPPQAMYDTLFKIVFPAHRPGDILLYEQSLNDWTQPQNLGIELARWARDAKTVEPLREAIAARQSGTSGVVPAAVLEVAVAVETADYAAAVAPLKALQKVATPQTGPRQQGSTLLSTASHAAALAFPHAPLKEHALPIVDAAARSLSSNSSLQARGPLLLLVEHHIRTGDGGKVQPLIDAFLQGRQAYYAQYSGDYGIYQQKQELRQIVTSLATTGDARLTLDYLGRFEDVPVTRNYGDVTLTTPILILARQLTRRTPQERYETWRDWTLPAEKRRTIRFLAEFSGGDITPAVFRPESQRDLPPAPPIGLVSNIGLLIDAARESGQLAELRKLVEPLVAEKLPRAETLLTAILLAEDSPEAAPSLEAVLARVNDRIKGTTTTPATPASTSNNAAETAAAKSVADQRWDEFLLVERGFASPKNLAIVRRLAPRVVEDHRKGQVRNQLPHLYRLLALDAIRDLSEADREAAVRPGLAHWMTAGPAGGIGQGSATPSWWSVHDDALLPLCNSEFASGLYWRSPLEGTFEFSFEAASEELGEAQFGYAGLVCQPQHWSNRVSIQPHSQNEVVQRAAPITAVNWANRYRLQISPERVRYFVNEHLVYEDSEPSRTSPWLLLGALDQRRAALRNLRLTGEPKVPREVRLVEGNRFDGWSAPQGEKIEPRLSLREPPPKVDPNNPREVDTRPADWFAEEGILQARLAPNVSNYPGVWRSRLIYHRPLVSGDTVRCEFLYRPDQVEVSPTLGPVTFLLRPEGIRVHWLNTSPYFDIPADNVQNEPENRRREGPLPLRPDDWNALELTLKDRTAEIRLNGTLVYQRPMEAGNDLRFGFFRDRTKHAVQIRNVVLTGDWPKELGPEVLGNLLARAHGEESAELRRARSVMTREENFVDDPYGVWKLAQGLPPEERFAVLRDWVLPGAGHSTFRLQGAFVPVDSRTLSPAAAKADAAVRGGDFVAPAAALVATAAELNRLPELEQLLENIDESAPHRGRNVAALKTLIGLARQDSLAAAQSLKVVFDGLKALPADTAVLHRSPEVLAAHAALGDPNLRTAVLPIAELIVTQQQTAALGQEWDRKVRWLRSRARWLTSAETAALPMQTRPDRGSQWAVVSYPSPEFRGRGYPAATWRLAPGRAEFHTGQGDDTLLFQSPLTGNFEVSARRTTNGWREISLEYAAVGIDLFHDGKSLRRNPFSRAGSSIDLKEKIDRWGAEVDYVLRIQEGKMKVEVNGKPVHEEPVPVAADPWLAIRSSQPQLNGVVSNLRITGSPTIPEAIDLSVADNLASWRPDYGDTIDAKDAIWRKDKAEIVGSVLENAPGSKRESLLVYRRPLVEDGTLEYDFYYEPGKTAVFPALGRVAVLFSETGVRTHVLTDGPYERSGIEPGNEAPLAGGLEKPPLKSADWNHLSLAVKGDVLALTLNGERLGEIPIAADNSRLFGFFRFRDEAASRIKNVRYRGEWPKVLPPVAEQTLAAPDAKVARE
ncbi:DUF1583 domain-containing protein [Planctomyces sp. SH-PL14]|uniref:DUF1583 domain-containing protein n=1 Tax=Planctomyces sp. SH-PL14 TaxID=1632864 RepID=UPI00078BC780|nr:DUF1583 domain-containing protein [Planctomyces sp. SH-PL14]AMV19156.1 tetratricopeptide repeat protein [Planctomyces sp. SH-PL14]